MVSALLEAAVSTPPTTSATRAATATPIVIGVRVRIGAFRVTPGNGDAILTSRDRAEWTYQTQHRDNDCPMEMLLTQFKAPAAFLSVRYGSNSRQEQTHRVDLVRIGCIPSVEREQRVVLWPYRRRSLLLQRMPKAMATSAAAIGRVTYQWVIAKVA